MIFSCCGGYLKAFTVKLFSKTYQLVLAIFLACSSLNTLAADSYDAATSTLTIPSVAVGDTLYTNVKITLGAVLSLGAQTPTESYDTYNALNNQLSIPAVSVGTSNYYNVIITVGNILSVGGSCAGVATCYAAIVAASNSSSGSNAKYYAPSPFVNVLQQSYQATSLVSASALTTRSRYMLSDSAAGGTTGNFLTIGSTYSASTGYTIESSTLTSASTLYSYLTKLVIAVSDSSGNFRLDSHLHPNNAIDADTSDNNKLKFRNNFGKASVTYGYVTFTFDSSNKLLQSKKRYKYSYDASTYAATYTEDTAFSAANYYVKQENGVYKLVADAASATKIYLYNSPLDLSIPSDFNPASISFVTNADVAFQSGFNPSQIEGTTGSIYKNTNSKYKAQVTSVGSNADTKTAADTLLATIKSTLAANGESLRYDTEVYSAYRDGLLKSVLASDTAADTAPGQNLVPYVYFTNEQDSSGKYHPFMIITTYGNPAWPNGLRDIHRPPGQSSGSLGYGELKVTRFSNLGYGSKRIPMKDYGNVTVVTENAMTSTLLNDAPNTTQTADVYNFASIGDNGVLIDGSGAYPVFNNTLVPAQSAGELSAYGCHVGQGGGGPHCHADGYRSGNPLALYGDSDYASKTHPPLIGFGYDGIALFGRYRTSDTAMLGFSTALDNFGAHNHDSIGYHYHAHTVSNFPLANSTKTYTLEVLMKGAYIGKLNSVPCFLTSCTQTDLNKYVYGN